MEKIGFIGLGNMGGEVARAIGNGGYPLTVCDINRDAANKFSDIATVVPSHLDVLGKSDIVFLSLPSTKIVEPIIESFISEGVDGKIIADTSTSYPMSTKRLFDKVKAAGGHLADVPISGMPDQALDGKLMCMFGGEREIYGQLKQCVACYADKYPYMGGSGSGHITKLIFNFIALSYVNIYAMAFPLTEKMGMDNHQLLELLGDTGMSCGLMDFYIPKMIGKTYDMAFALGLAHKDLTYVKNMFEEYQVPAYALDGTLDLLRTSIRDGKGEKDYSICIETMFEFFENK